MHNDVRDHMSAIHNANIFPDMGIYDRVMSLFKSFNNVAVNFVTLNWWPGGSGNDNNKPPEKLEDKTHLSPMTKLKLEFSKAADYNRINRLFDPAVKKHFDPQGYIVKREEPILRRAVNNSNCTMLSTSAGDIAALTFAYNIHAKPNSKPHEYTEIGTTLSRMGGYNAAQLVIAAMALREWWENAPKGLIVTEILPTNVPSLKTYGVYLGWRPIGDQNITKELHRLCNETIAPENKGNQTIWFHCDDSVITHQARI